MIGYTELGQMQVTEGTALRTAVASIGGGLASELTGGKFANGAITAAFAHMFNHELHFNGSSVKLIDDDKNTIGEYSATSGKEGITDAKSPYAGPIPEGEYEIRPSEISEVYGIWKWARNLLGDWGSYRSPPSTG